MFVRLFVRSCVRSMVLGRKRKARYGGVEIDTGVEELGPKLSEPNSARPSFPSSKKSPKGGGLRVLIGDKETTIRRTMGRYGTLAVLGIEGVEGGR